MVVIWKRPDVKDIKATYDNLFNSSHTLSKIRDAALEGRLLDTGSLVAGRSIVWKLFLLSPEAPLQPEPIALIPSQYSTACAANRKEYQALLLEKMRAPDGSYEEGVQIPGLATAPPKRSASAVNLDMNNPLSLHVENPWKEWFAAMDLKKTVAQDVERTFPDIAYFRDVEVQGHLTNILYLWSTMNPEIGYRQGMHELLAMIYIAVDHDSIDDGLTGPDAILNVLCARTWVVADAWALFVAIMHGMGKWYEWREPSTQVKSSSHLQSHIHLPLENGQVNIPSYVAPVVQSCNKIQSQYLKTVDPLLWRSMQAAGIEPQIFGIRWLRLLFTREFSIEDSMVLWDGILACDVQFNIAEWVCVAMLLRIRNQLIPADYSEQLTCLLRYPALTKRELFDPLTPHPSTLLLRQALALQFSPTAATGSSVAIENRNLLYIPLEVPEPPPPPPRRQNRHVERAKSPSDSSSGTIRTSHLKQLSQQAQGMGLPDIARGLLDRGESLGINKTSFFNAVSELRRNLPDLAASAASLVKSPNQQASFPLIDEPAMEERPPWEPKTRREMELEIETIKATQQRLGESVAWIVDVLLQSEDEQNQEQTEKLRQRKREALECLAHIRDVLQGHVSSVEDDRLWDEEELARRRLKHVPPAVSVAHTVQPAQPAAIVVAPISAAKPIRPASPPNVVRNRPVDKLASRSFNTPSLPASTSAPLPVSPSSSPSHTPSMSSIAGGTGAMPLAPWKYTKSDFQASSPALSPPKPASAALPRKVSPQTNRSAPVVPPASHTPKSPVVAYPVRQSWEGNRKDRQEVDHDPLGALR